MSNLHDRGTLKGMLQRNSGNYNDLINKPGINGHVLIGDQSGHALGLANEDDIIYVEANPLGSATTDLHKILVDDTIYSIPDVIVYGEASGAIASFDDGGDNKPLKSLKVTINPVQASGTPSPSNPLPISGWDECKVNRTGKNRIDKTQLIDNRVVNSTGQEIPASTNWCVTPPIKIDANSSYYLTDGVGALSMITGCLYGNNMAFLRTVSFAGSGTQSGVINTGNDSVYLRVNIYKEKTDSVQLEKGSTATAYEPYNGTTFPITWSEAGEVFGGYIDYERKKLVVNRAEYNIISTRNFTQNGADIIAMNVSSLYQKDVIPLCECFEGITKGYSSGLSANQCRFNNNLSAINFRFSANKTVDEWKAELANNPIQLILGLVEPIEFDLDEPVPTITTLLGNNNIWSDTGDITECVYQRDINIALNKALSQ